MRASSIETRCAPRSGDSRARDALWRHADDIMDVSRATAPRQRLHPRPGPCLSFQPKPEPPAGSTCAQTDCADSPARLNQIDYPTRRSRRFRHRSGTPICMHPGGSRRFLHLRASMEPQRRTLRYCLKYSDYPHRLDHPMCARCTTRSWPRCTSSPPAGPLMAVQIALTPTGYPARIARRDKASRPCACWTGSSDTLPRMNVGAFPRNTR